MNITRGMPFLPRALQPNGNGVGTWKGRPGKTKRDKATGAWSNRLANRADRASNGGKKGKGK